ncbi:MAG: hypothetical protein E3J72_18505 [Planctomycetota bacterium]|nr:MAG: hypothetical protein E3J72_18505 [Planctomycetota bacterium]
MHNFETPIYTASMAGRLVGLSADRTRRWLKGYEKVYKSGPTGKKKKLSKSPVIKRGRTNELYYASFLDLIEMLFIKEFINFGFSLQKLRNAIKEAMQRYGGHHPFAQRRFFTDGRKIYTENKNNSSVPALLELLSGGQNVFKTVIKPYLAAQVVFERPSIYPKRWFPTWPDKTIIIDPAISFGQPFLGDKGIITANIYDLFLGEGEKINKVTSWLNISKNEAKAAIQFERRIAKAS